MEIKLMPVKIILICVILAIIAIPTLQVIDSIRDSLRKKNCKDMLNSLKNIVKHYKNSPP